MSETSKEQSLRRLNEFKDFLNKNHEKIWERLDLTIWRGVKHFNGVKPYRDKISNLRLKKDCETVACLIGWFITDPRPRKQGLVYQNDMITYNSGTKQRPNHSFNYSALIKYFGLNQQNYESFLNLIQSGNYRGKPSFKTVMGRLQKLIREVQDGI